MKQTPYWEKGRKAVHLSAGDKVCLALKIHDGSWSRFINERKRDAERREELQADFERAKRIHEFERKNKLKFIQEGADCDSFFWIPVRYKTQLKKERAA